MPLDDLAPYQSLLLLRVKSGVTLSPLVEQMRDAVGGLVPKLVPTAILEPFADAQMEERVTATYVRYSEKRRATWSLTNEVEDQLNQLIVIARVRRLLALYASDSRIRTAFLSRVRSPEPDSIWAGLAPISQGVLNAAFVDGPARTLWLSGAHRRSSIKADAKVLAGTDLRDALDPLDDQSFHFTAARSRPSGMDRIIGASPRKSGIWIGPSRSWPEFRSAVRAIADRLDNVSAEVTAPLPVLATATTDASEVAGAFDLSIQPPELLSEGSGLSEEERQDLSVIADRSFFDVTAGTGADLTATVAIEGDAVGKLKLNVDVTDPQSVRVEVADSQEVEGQQARLDQVVRMLLRRDILKIRYESGHAVSDGAVFFTRPRDLPFTNWEFVDFETFRVDQEKPALLSETGQHQSLFDWVQLRWPCSDPQRGWLASDDGAMEIADFIHLDDASDPPSITLIHVKGAGSSSPGRRISVSNYEVVSAQAVKNLRFLDRRGLIDGLSDGLNRNVAVLAWHDGQQATRQAMIKALDRIRGGNIERRIVILQPHVREKTLSDIRQRHGPPDDLARLRQLDTLLHSVDSSCRALGARLTVLSAI